MPIRDYSTTPASNTSLSGIGLGEGVMTVASINDAFRQVMSDVREVQARASIASASSVAIGAANAESLDVTGTTTITSFDAMAAGVERELVFAGALTLTHNATSLILPTGASIVTAAGDVARVRSLGGGNWKCTSYARADGTAVGANFASNAQAKTSTATNVALTPASAAAGGDGAWVDFASAATTDIGAQASRNIRITGTTSIVSFGTTDSGVRRHLRFVDALTLAYNATSLILPGAAGITTAAGDTCTAVSLGSGNWVVTDYTRASGLPLAGTPLPFTKSYTSPAQVITSAGALALAHGLGVQPTLVQTRLTCISAEAGYSIGDEVIITAGDGDTIGVNRGVSVVADATNINIRFGSNGNTFIVVNKSLGTSVVVTNANWGFIVRAWA